MTSSDQPLAVGQSVSGFTVMRTTPLPDLRSTACELHHPGSGARLLHVCNADTENLFSVVVPTPPPDNTGVPHILEHAVLAGSQRFPVKEPFFEMLKMSMATFINAMTGPDCTYYPVASCVKRDLFNLADVYFDAVFHPLLSQTTFQREAHHLAPQDPANPRGALTVNGIVYNEMKGAFSNPEARLYYAQSRGLFPDTIYGLESGGDPDAIPELTYEALQDFHRRFYTPANARFFLYGNIPTRDYLAFLGPRLDVFTAPALPPPISRQPVWEVPRQLADTYPVAPDEPLKDKTYLVMSWRCYDATDPSETVLLRIIALLLLGNEAAPLRKALIDSGLGADLALAHADTMGCEGIFAVGLKGSAPDRRAAFERCVLDTLTTVADSRIAPDAVDAAFQQAAYPYLEIQTLFPLHLMDNVIQSWLYGDDPLPFLDIHGHLQTCRDRYAADPDLFSTLIRERLLNNPHRLTVTMVPDPDHARRCRDAFTARMRNVRTSMRDSDALRIAERAAALDRENGRPNTPAQLATLPQLGVSDLPADLVHIPTSIESAGPITLLVNDIPANGVNSLILHINLQGLPASLWPYLSHYATAIGKMGAAGKGYEVIAHEKSACTGGIGCAPIIMTHAADADQPVWGLRITLKTLDDRIEQALALLHDILFGIDPRNRQRLHDILAQMLAHCRTTMVHNGNSTAAIHAARGLNEEAHVEDLLHGLPQLELAEALAAAFEKRCAHIMANIEAIREFLLNRDRVTASFTGSPGATNTVQTALNAWAHEMGAGLPPPAPTGFRPYTIPPREGLAGPIQVAHCALAMPAPHFSHPDEPVLAVASHLVRMEYILNQIRFKGNAYGANFNHIALLRRITMGSFNDPHITRTLSILADTQAFVEQADWTQTDVDRAIIATAKDMNRPLRPAAATHDALTRHLAGLTRERRATRYARMRSVTPAAARRTLRDALSAGYPHAAICVVAGRDNLEAANRETPHAPLAIRDILTPHAPS